MVIRCDDEQLSIFALSIRQLLCLISMVLFTKLESTLC